MSDSKLVTCDARLQHNGSAEHPEDWSCENPVPVDYPAPQATPLPPNVEYEADGWQDETPAATEATVNTTYGKPLGTCRVHKGLHPIVRRNTTADTRCVEWRRVTCKCGSVHLDLDPYQYASSVPSHGSAGIGAGAENTARVVNQEVNADAPKVAPSPAETGASERDVTDFARRMATTICAEEDLPSPSEALVQFISEKLQEWAVAAATPIPEATEREHPLSNFTVTDIMAYLLSMYERKPVIWDLLSHTLEKMHREG